MVKMDQLDPHTGTIHTKKKNKETNIKYCDLIEKDLLSRRGINYRRLFHSPEGRGGHIVHKLSEREGV